MNKDTNYQSYFREEKINYIEYIDFLKITKKVYGRKIKMMGEHHGAFYRFEIKDIGDNVAVAGYMSHAINTGELERWQYGAVFYDLYIKGIIKEGVYLLGFNWS